MKENKNNIALGIICILISCLGFSLMQVFIRLAGDIPAIEKTFFRNLIASFVVIIPLLKSKEKITIGKENIPMLLLRSIFGTIGIVLNFYAVERLSLADSAVILKLSPFIVILLSLIFLKEKVKPYQWMAVFVAFIGIIFVVKPEHGFRLSSGDLAALGGAISAGSAYTCLRYLNKKQVNKEFIILFFSVFSCISLLPFVVLNFVPMTSQQLFYTLMIGLSATMGQFGITYGYYFSQASKVSVYEYSQVLFAGFFGYFIFDQVPDLKSIIGYVIIVGVGIYMFRRETKVSQSEGK